ncbi:MAG TPA: aldehyde dehydrogenase [Edaphocola sp.]|nr:aldehyde dehydrogenase [Edaphocola sp.]
MEKLSFLNEIVVDQRAFFKKGVLLDINYRKELLLKLKTIINQNESFLYDAIKMDFGKSAFETFATELSLIYAEIDYFLKNLNKLAKPKSVATNLANQLGKSKIYTEAYGAVLVIGAWNYPYQLSLLPAVSALAAGNTVLLKPSEIAFQSALIIEKIINENFPKEVFHVVNGGVAMATALLKIRFDKIFFTGSPQVGKIVYKAAAEYLTPVTLELGGKSPTIVTQSANLKVAARRIVWGKFLNAGQTCIAPDYIYVHHSVKKEFIEEIIKHIKAFQYTPDSENYTYIINKHHFDRLLALMDSNKIIYGGNANPDVCFIEPTIMDNVNWEDKIMQEEIFGPILPILVYQDLEEVFKTIDSNEKPLSAYIFTSDNEDKDLFVKQLSFGGACINDTIMHVSNPNLPFGGVGNSGMGSYHGKYGFDTFSHKKSVLEKRIIGEPKIKYPPYTSSKKKWIEKLI